MRITDENIIREIRDLITLIQKKIGRTEASNRIGISTTVLWRIKSKVSTPAFYQVQKVYEAANKMGIKSKYRNSMPKGYWDRSDQRASKESREEILLRNYRLYVLEQCGWNRVNAAKILGCCDRSIRNWIKDYKEIGYVIPSKIDRNCIIPSELDGILNEWEFFKNMDKLKERKNGM